MANPMVKSCGGKRQLLPALSARVPDSFNTYHEPFVGGGALFFHLQAQGRINRAVLSDVNARLIRTYVAVRDHVDEVIARVQKMPIDRESFYRLRGEAPDDGTDVEMGAWYLWVNRTAYNGLYRENKAGRFNVSYGTPKAPIIDPDTLRASSKALQGVELRCEDFTAVERAEEGDFVYLDPPYWPRSETASFVSYTSGGFTAADQKRLRDTAQALKARGVHVLLSNSDTPQVRALYDGFTIDRVSARRAINCKADRRDAVGEVLIR